MFRDAKVGDRVWSPSWGWGTVVDNDPNCDFPICVEFDAPFDANPRFKYDGKGLNYYHNEAVGVGKQPGIYWDEVKFEIPPRPKRKVKKAVEGFIGISPLRESGINKDAIAHTSHIYKDLYTAKLYTNHDWIVVPIRHEYEVEE
jgi:hypothetical protein